MPNQAKLSHPEIDQHLPCVAKLAIELAPKTCHPNTGVLSGCAWYHSVWPTLRALNVISGLRAEREFFTDRFRELAATGEFARVLICGSADIEMLALLVDAYESEKAPLQVDLLDRCSTPLQLNRWFADQNKIDLTTHCFELFNFQADRQFDLICTHSLFSFVAPTQIQAVTKRWSLWLRDEGRVVTSQLIRPCFPSERLQFTEDQAREFGARATKSATAQPELSPVTPQELEELAYQFAINRRSFLVRDEDQLAEAFAAAGFRFEHFAPAPTEVQQMHRGASPDTFADRIRCQLCAIKQGPNGILQAVRDRCPLDRDRYQSG